MRGLPLPALRSVATPRNMAWTCSATSNDALVDKLVAARLVSDDRVQQALRLVDRRAFLPPNTRPETAYADEPLPLQCSATISAPHMHAMALNLLREQLVPGARALDIGSGSGYLTACMAVLVGPTGVVVGIEHASPLAQFAEANLRNFEEQVSADMAAKIVLRTADGRLGDSEHAPFSAIHVGAAAPSIPPALVSQLANGGKMVVPVGPPMDSQRLVLVTKDATGTVAYETVCGVRYVPLCDLNSQTHV